MADPVRWLSDPASAPEGALELLRAAAPMKEMSAASHARALLHVTQLSTAKATALGVLASAKTAALVIASTTAAAAAVTSMRTRTESAPSVPTVAITAPERAAPERGRRAVEQAPEQAAGHILQLEDLERVRPEDSIASPGAAEVAERVDNGSAPEKAALRGDLAAERALIERARASLRPDPEQALALAREHQVRYPAGQLLGAARVIEVEALRALDRAAEAQERANATIQSDPNGLYTERMSRAARPQGGARQQDSHAARPQGGARQLESRAARPQGGARQQDSHAARPQDGRKGGGP